MSMINNFQYHFNVQFLGRALLRLNRVRNELQTRNPSRRRSEYLAPSLKIAPRMKELVGRHWLQGRYANLHEKVAWVTSGAPVELLKALDYYVLYPENHAAICGTARAALEISTEAEKAGYSSDICSYARTDIGTVLSGKTPVGRLPKPDLLLACTNICQTVLYWYRVLAEHFKVPLIVIDTPFVYHEQAPDHAIEYVVKQLEDAIEVAEQVAGRSLDHAKFEETSRLSQRASELWMQVMERNSHSPAPISVIDQFIHMAPVVEMRGDASTVDFYAALLDEVDARIREGIAAVRDERKRLLWDNLPIWYRLRYLGETLGENRIALVASTYTNAWGELAQFIDPTRPLESLARVYTYPILNRSTGHKLATMVDMIEKYHLDGVILHSDRSCKPYSIGQIDQRDRLLKEHGLPALLLEADHNDPRAFSQEQVARQMTAFIEMLET